MSKLVELIHLPLDESDANKEIYAHFGLAVYLVQCLEHNIMNGIFFLDFLPKALKENVNQLDWERSVDDYYSELYKNVFGRLVNRLLSTEKIPSHLKIELEKSRPVRNQLVHNFFRSHDISFYSKERRDRMLFEIVEAANLFILTSDSLSQFLAPFEKNLGFTEEYFQEIIKRMLEKKVKTR